MHPNHCKMLQFVKCGYSIIMLAYENRHKSTVQSGIYLWLVVSVSQHAPVLALQILMNTQT